MYGTAVGSVTHQKQQISEKRRHYAEMHVHRLSVNE